MTFLTGLRPYRNFEHPDSLEKVCTYIEDTLRHFGYAQAEYQRWTPDVLDQSYSNLILRYNPGQDHKLVVGAHYDVCGDQPGADDNGSAVVGLMETARLLAEARPSLGYTVEIVWYCLEEPPFFDTPYMGSYIHAESCNRDRATKTLAMINFEMIGYFSDLPGSQILPHEEIEGTGEIGDVGDFICAVGIREHDALVRFVASHMQQQPAIRTHGIIFDDPHGWAGLSDHRNYWDLGIPALMINNTAMLRNRNYHQPTDDYDTIDFERMAAVVHAVWNAVTGFDAYIR
jgi:Zn-dependent M28 family amino/carboxypeptidase